MKFPLMLLILLCLCHGALAHEGKHRTDKKVVLLAEQITPANRHLAIGGSSAIAGIDDWMLSNGTLCASITDPTHETYLSHRGGTLVDLGFCGRDDDRFHTWHEMFNLSRDQILPAGSLRTEVTGNSASLVVSGEISGVRNETRYRLSVEHPTELHIETRLTRVAESDELFLFGTLMLHPHRSLTPYSISTTHPEFSKGFHHPLVDTTDKLAMLEVMSPTDLHVLVGPPFMEKPIRYAVQSLSAHHINTKGQQTPLRQFAINNDEFTLLGNFSNRLWFDTEGAPGLLQFAQTSFMDLALGESLLIQKRITVSPRTESPASTDDATKTHTARLQLPKGEVMQLVFKGLHGTADPVLFPDPLDFRIDGKRYEQDISSNRYSLCACPGDLSELRLPPGSYRVYGLRGPEHALHQTDITLRAHETTMLTLTAPPREMASEHWIAADFHVHSEYSFDSAYPVHWRIADFYTQGGEVMVASEHKRTVDFSPHLREMGLQDKIIALTGVELSGMAHTPKIPRTMGHSNVFPIKEDASAYLGGTLPHEDKRLGEIIGDYKNIFPESIFQLNHPRASQTPDADIHFLDHLSIDKVYDPAKPLDDSQNRSLMETHPGSTYRDIDFDALELLNGEDLASYERVRADWFSFLRQGHRKTGTANSDSHHATQLVALPRNYVRVANDRIQHFDLEDFLAAIRRGDLIGSTGPRLDVTLEGKRMGETFIGTAGTLQIDISSARWVPVNKLVVYVNGKVAAQQEIPGPGTYPVPLQFTQDSFVTVEVSGKPSEAYAAVYPGFYPFAFSNPVFVEQK